MAGDRRLGSAGIQTIETAGVDQLPRLRPCLPCRDRIGCAVGFDHLANSQFVAGCEGHVPLIVSGHAHDSAGAVVGQHVVSDPDRQLLSREWIDHTGADGDTPLGSVVAGAFQVAESCDLLLKATHGIRVISIEELIHQRMFRSQHHVTGSGQRVRPGGEHREGGGWISGDRKGDLGPLRSADPVGLHGADTLGPAVELIQVLEQCLGVVGDAQKPLIQLPLLHQGPGTPGSAVGIHLFVRQHRLVDGIPVDRRVLAVRQPTVKEFKEQPLGPAVVIAVAGRLFAIPVDGQSETVELAAHLFDVSVRPFAGVDIPFDRCVLCRKAEGIPSHRMKNGMAAHPLHPRDHIRDHVVAHVTHVQSSRGIREHRQRVENRSCRILWGSVRPKVTPTRLPALLQFGGLVAAVHGRPVDGKAAIVPQPAVSAEWTDHADLPAPDQHRALRSRPFDRQKFRVLPDQPSFQSLRAEHFDGERTAFPDPGLQQSDAGKARVQWGGLHRIRTVPQRSCCTSANIRDLATTS